MRPQFQTMNQLFPSSTDLRRIQTPHSLFRAFRSSKIFTICWSRQSSCRIQVWVQLWAPAGHLEITPQYYFRRQLKVLGAKSMAEPLGQRSSTAWADMTSKHKHRVFPTWWQSLLAATGSLEEKKCRHSCKIDLVQESIKVYMLWEFLAKTTEFFLMGYEVFNATLEFVRIYSSPKQSS